MIHEYKETADFEETMPIGAFLKKVRRLMGLNQTDMGDIIGVNQGTLSAWETGASSPPFEIGRKVIGLLGGEVRIVYSEDEEKRSDRAEKLLDILYESV